MIPARSAARSAAREERADRDHRDHRDHRHEGPRREERADREHRLAGRREKLDPSAQPHAAGAPQERAGASTRGAGRLTASTSNKGPVMDSACRRRDYSGWNVAKNLGYHDTSHFWAGPLRELGDEVVYGTYP